MQTEIEAYSVETTAKTLSISQRQLHRLIAGREIASLKIGRRRLVTPQAIKDFIRRSETIAR
jgi:excisionase family DNA binding protein